ETVEAQVVKRRKAARADRSLEDEVRALEAASAVLNAGTPIYRSSLTADERAGLRPFFLLTNKPVLAVVNLGEDQIAGPAEVVAPVAAELGGAGAPVDVLGVSVQLEAEAARLDSEGRAELLEGLGLGEGALARVARAAHHLLG